MRVGVLLTSEGVRRDVRRWKRGGDRQLGTAVPGAAGKRAQHTEVSLGVLLGVMLLGLGELIRRWHVVPHSGTTVLAQLTEGAVGDTRSTTSSS